MRLIPRHYLSPLSPSSRVRGLYYAYLPLPYLLPVPWPIVCMYGHEPPPIHERPCTNFAGTTGLQNVFPMQAVLHNIKGPLVLHAALLGAYYPLQMQTYCSSIWLPWQSATVSQNCLLTPVGIAR